MASLLGRSILVVSATGGLGAHISRQLADEGSLLTLHGRDEARLGTLGLSASLVTGDLRDPNTAARAVASAVSAHGQFDGLVIASGVALGRWVTSPTRSSPTCSSSMLSLPSG